MVSPSLRLLCVVAAVLATSLLRADETAEVKVWRFENPANLSGAQVDTWGAPAFSKDSSGPLVRFDGKADGLIVPVIPLAGWKNFTIEILFAVDADGLPEQRFLHLQDEKGGRVLIELRLLPDNQWCLDTFLYTDQAHRLTLIDRSKARPVGRWQWAALSYADGRMTHFVEGVKECEGAIQFEPMSAAGRTSLGVRQNKVSWFKGAIREVRFTPEALPGEKLQRVGKSE